MNRDRQQLIPRRTHHAVSNTLFTSDWAASWSRVHRQVFWLSDGQRDTQRIATLLHKPESRVGKVVKELTVSGYTSLLCEKKILVMDVGLLKQSFEMIASQKDPFAYSFYQRLFSYYPQVQPLFAQTDMRRQTSSLMATLAVVISGVERGDNLLPTIQALGEKHRGYGAMSAHYPLVGGVLLETFGQFLGSQFTLEMQDAWSQAYELISTEMMADSDG